jgi:hypothetical protein
LSEWDTFKGNPMTQSIPETIQQKQAETVGIADLDQFVALLSSWHQNRVAQMKKFLEIPEDTQVISEESSQPVTLTGDVRVGFLIGITTGLAILGELPFVVEMDPAVTPNA